MAGITTATVSLAAAARAKIVHALLDQIEHEEAAGEHQLSVIRKILAHFWQHVQVRGG